MIPEWPERTPLPEEVRWKIQPCALLEEGPIYKLYRSPFGVYLWPVPQGRLHVLVHLVQGSASDMMKRAFTK